MKILYVTSEAAPFAASGGLGDVMGALPKSVASEEGVTAEVILPFYEKAMKDEYKSHLEKVIDISFRLSWRNTGATVYKINKDGINYYFVENHYYFDRPNLYGEYDDGERFAFFSLAVLEFIKQTGNVPDIIHANDWQTALTVVYLKTVYAKDPILSAVKTVYTIHNIEYQGKYDKYILTDVFGLDSKDMDTVEYDGCINLMKGGIVATDILTTVSPNSANELKYDYYAFGLAEIIKESEGKMHGVINGIDYSYFSPENGGDIYKKYTKRSLCTGKSSNKLALQRELGLAEDPDIPLIVMITRLTAGKGIDLVVHVANELFDEKLQFVILGTGEESFENIFTEYERYYSNVRALIKFDRITSKRMYAAADMFLMPSKSEPCGLAQMISCSYGTVPIVHAVGGLYDSIKSYPREDSNGFTFENYNAHELLFTVKSALDLYHNDKDEWQKLRQRAKSSDFSWDNSAIEYIKLYRNLL